MCQYILWSSFYLQCPWYCWRICVLQTLGVPCFLGGMSRGLLGRNSPIQCRQKRGECLKQADTIILLGSVCDFRLSYGRSLNRKAKIIAVNRDKGQLYRVFSQFNLHVHYYLIIRWQPGLSELFLYIRWTASKLNSYVLECSVSIQTTNHMEWWVVTLCFQLLFWANKIVPHNSIWFGVSSLSILD